MPTPSEILIFWTGIMRDHAEFYLLSLSSRESEMIKASNGKGIEKKMQIAGLPHTADT